MTTVDHDESILQEYLDFAKDLGIRAADIIKSNFKLGMNKEWKEDDTPLTVTDTEINQMVIDSVRQSFPEHGVLGEEDSFDTGKEYLWVVDPVDGTMPFSHGIPSSVFSLALVHKGKSVVAVVADPFTDRLYTAAIGMGSSVNGQPLRVNNDSELNSKVFIDISGKPEFIGFSVIGILTKLMENQVRVTRSFTAVFNALPVVTGQHGASIILLSYPWDGAAISLITTEAGGKVTDLYGNEREWNKDGDGFIVSNGAMHDKIVELVKSTNLKF